MIEALSQKDERAAAGAGLKRSCQSGVLADDTVHLAGWLLTSRQWGPEPVLHGGWRGTGPP